MHLYGLSAIGRDRPGIVAAISRVLLELKGNVEDSQMAILRGHFESLVDDVFRRKTYTAAPGDRQT